MKKRLASVLIPGLLLAGWLLAGCSQQGPAPSAEQGPAKKSADRELEAGSFHVELDGFNINYEVHGQGPVVMTLPNSWGLNIAGLRALYRPLEEHWPTSRSSGCDRSAQAARAAGRRRNSTASKRVT